MNAIKWTSEEVSFIKELHQKGSIKIATKISFAIYLPQSDGTITGFHYNVLKEFADLLKIKIHVKLITWNDYFYKEGEDLERVKKDPDYAFVPSLIKNVDLYLDGITALPWREKLFDIIKFVPSRQMIVSRKENLPLNLSDLNNKVCAMVKNTSMEYNHTRSLI
jgi:membrane-bound lytic murein transglycosylase MltF